jgi:hypothetical protein
MTHSDLRSRFDGYWITGSGNFAIVCSSARRNTLFSTLEVAMDAKHMNCARGCARYQEPHLGFKLEAPAPAKLSDAFMRMVRDA